jgi:hypothetical protein
MEIFRLLLHHPKVDVAAENNYAFRIACIRDNVEMVKILLKDDRVDPTACMNLLKFEVIFLFLFFLLCCLLLVLLCLLFVVLFSDYYYVILFSR